MLDTSANTKIPPSSGRGGGAPPQSTEEAIGPYALQDFTLFHVLRQGLTPQLDRVPGRARLVRDLDRGDWPPIGYA